jgi:hypothetical protein
LSIFVFIARGAGIEPARFTLPLMLLFFDL